MKQNYTPVPADHEPKAFGLFVREKPFYKTFFSLLIVIALQQLAALMVNLVDNIMLGSYTELALNGATLVNQIQFMLQQVAIGTGMGIVVLGSQYWGKGQTDPIKKIISVGIKFGLLIGILFFAAAQLFPHQLLNVFTNDETIIAEGMRYLRVISWTYIIFAVSNSLMYSLQAVETAAIGTVMSISTIFINLCLNYVFIYGHFGAPELGIVGAAVATLVSRSVELVIILVYVLFIDKKLHLRMRDLLQLDFTYLGDYFRVATPVIVSGFLWGIAQAAQTAVLGHMSATAIAANSISAVVSQIFTIVGFSCANVASIMMGKTIGEGKLHKVRAYSKSMQGLFLCIGLTLGVLMFLLKGPILSIYNISDETRRLTLQFLTVLSITAVGSSYEFPCEGGIIAGGGTTKYQAYVDNLFIWLLVIPSASLSAFVFRFPPIVTFCCLKVDQVLKCIPNGIVTNRYHWVKILTKDAE